MAEDPQLWAGAWLWRGGSPGAAGPGGLSVGNARSRVSGGSVSQGEGGGWRAPPRGGEGWGAGALCCGGLPRSVVTVKVTILCG